MDRRNQSTVVLNAKQREVLAWIKAGFPPGVYVGDSYAHRQSARALSSRGLIKIFGRGTSWSAVTTPRGEAWPTATVEDAVIVGDRKRSVAVKGLTRVEARQAVVNELTRRLVTAGESLTLDDEEWSYDELGWMNKAAERSPDRPHGQVLSIRRTGYRSPGRYVLTFEPYFRDLVDQTDVVVPVRVSKYRPQVREFIDDKDYQYVSKQHVPRAARIYQAIIIEGERRGLPQPTYDRGTLSFSTEHGAYTFEVREQGSWSQERMYIDEQRRLIRQGTPLWKVSDFRKFTGSGKLRMRQGSPPSSYKGTMFADRKIVRLEDRLTEAFIRFEIWQLESIERQRQWRLREEERAREQERKKRALEAAKAQARIDYEADTRWKHFRELSHASEEATRQREFLRKARESVQTLPDDERTSAMGYLREMEAAIASHDPLTAPELIVPNVKEPDSSDLEPFIQRHNPLGT